jgi:hypothetical protein
VSEQPPDVSISAHLTPTNPEFITRQRIIERLMTRAGGAPTCPMCSHHEFAIGSFVQLPVTNNATVMALGRFLPCVSAICTTCGAVQLISLLNLGFTKEELAQMPNDA